MDYIDDYAACELTYATLQIYPPGATDPAAITRQLGMTPSEVCSAGTDEYGRSTVSGWFLCSDDMVESRDSRRHIDWILDQIEPVAAQILAYRAAAYRVEIFCYWVSASGNGGPVISPKQMRRLAALDIEVGWDVWFAPDEADAAG